MNRRTLLATIAAGTLAAGAGCAGRLGPGSADETPSDTVVDDDRPDHTPDTIDDVGCPSFVDGADRTNCYRRVDRSAAAAYLEPSTFEFQDHYENGTVETIEFTLHNRGDVDFRYNPHDWAVYRFDDDAWSKVAPDERVQPLARLAPGETDTWSLSTEAHPSPSDDVRQVTADLRSGRTHAFRVVGDLGDGDDASRIECVAVFDYVRSVP